MARRTGLNATRTSNWISAVALAGMLAFSGLAGDALALDAAVQLDAASSTVSGTVTIPTPCGSPDPPCTDSFTITGLTVGTHSKPALVVGVALNESFNNGYSIASVTWVVGSITETLTRVQGSDNTLQTRRVEQWDFLGQTTGSGTITVTVTGPAGATVAYVAGAISLWNVTTRGPNACDTPLKGNEDAYPFRSLSRTYLRNGDVDFVAVPGNLTASADSPQTERWNTCTGSCGSSDLLGGGSTQPATNNTTNFSWTLSGSTSWVICAVDYRPYEPTLAQVNEYSAEPTARGTLIRWRTSYEFDNLGFRILRENADGSRTAVTPSLVAGSALFAGQGTPLSAGRSYQWLDTSGGSDRYWIEEVSLTGGTELHGPVIAPAVERPIRLAVAASEASTNSALLSGFGVRRSATGTTVASAHGIRRSVPSAWSAQATQWRLAASAAAKIAVRGEGWYRVGKAALVTAGFDPGNDPDALRLFVDGSEVAISVVDGGDGVFDAGDAIEFYGLGQDGAYSDARTYWLARDFGGGHAPLRIPNASPVQGASGPATYEATVERKDRTVYFAALMDPTRDNFFGPVIADEAVDQALTVDHLDRASGGAGSLHVVLQGATTAAHQVAVLINGQRLGDLNFTGIASAEATFPVYLAALLEGSNTVRLVGLGGSSDVSLVDSVQLTFPRALVAVGDRLSLTAPALVAMKLQGFTDRNVRVIDVSRPGAVVELPVVVESSGATFDATFASRDEADIFAFTAAQAMQPAAITANTPSNWNHVSNRADLVIVTHPSFAAAAQRLANLRSQEGLDAVVVDIEDAYDEFAFGAKDPLAIRTLLARSSTSWRQAPRFVVLLGDATMDPRDYLGQGVPDLVPTRMVPVEVLKTASDDWFVDFADTGIPQMAIGRLPARTVAEADAMVAKLEAYADEPAGAAWAQRAVFVSDADDDTLRVKFTEATRTIETHFPTAVSRSEILSGVLGQSEARAQTIAAINAGALAVTYVGHGTDTGWAGGGHLLSTADTQALSNGSKLPTVVALNCLNGLFESTTGDSLAEAFLKAPAGGAVAVLASSALTEAEGQTDLGTRFVDAAVRDRLAIGEALMRAKTEEVRVGVRKSFLLFGDPSMKLKQ